MNLQGFVTSFVTILKLIHGSISKCSWLLFSRTKFQVSGKQIQKHNSYFPDTQMIDEKVKWKNNLTSITGILRILSKIYDRAFLRK